MKRSTLYLVVFSIALCCFPWMGCSNDEEVAPGAPADLLIGYWVNPTYSDSCWRYEKAHSFQDDSYGILFQSNNRLVERKNSSWCGTPPISYGNYEGRWHMKDSVISIKVDFWGGEDEFKWIIQSLDEKQLTVFPVYPTP